MCTRRPRRLRWRRRDGSGRRVVGRPRGARGERGLGRHRGAVGNPGSRRGHADAERGRLRPGGRRDHLRRSVRYDRVDRAVRTLANAECGFGYRHSRFKGDDRYVVLEVAFQLREGDLAAAPVGTPNWPAARRQDRANVPRRRGPRGRPRTARAARAWCWTTPTTTPGAPAPSSPTRSSTADRAARCPTGAPRGRQQDGRVKTSAAWLIEQAGFGKGTGPGPAARSPTKHTLALTNRGAAKHGRPAARSPARSATACGRPSGSSWSTSRCWSAAPSRSVAARA